MRSKPSCRALNLQRREKEVLIGPARLPFSHDGDASPSSRKLASTTDQGRLAWERKCRPRRFAATQSQGQGSSGSTAEPGPLGGLGALCASAGKVGPGSGGAPRQCLKLVPLDQTDGRMSGSPSCASGSPSRGSGRVVSKVEIVDSGFRREISRTRLCQPRNGDWWRAKMRCTLRALGTGSIPVIGSSISRSGIRRPHTISNEIELG